MEGTDYHVPGQSGLVDGKKKFQTSAGVLIVDETRPVQLERKTRINNS